jgi:hypothetical protein
MNSLLVRGTIENHENHIYTIITGVSPIPDENPDLILRESGRSGVDGTGVAC